MAAHFLFSTRRKYFIKDQVGSGEGIGISRLMHLSRIKKKDTEEFCPQTQSIARAQAPSTLGWGKRWKACSLPFPICPGISCNSTLIILKTITLIAQCSAFSPTMTFLPLGKMLTIGSIRLFWVWSKHPWGEDYLVLQPKIYKQWKITSCRGSHDREQ